jgi:hypothetical protein
LFFKEEGKEEEEKKNSFFFLLLCGFFDFLVAKNQAFLVVHIWKARRH